MTKRASALLFLLLCVIPLGCASRGRRAALAVERAVERVASEGEIWPGFDPLAVPLAIYDGVDTYLFRHPHPPEGFVEERGVYVFEGRHPAVVANCSASIGEVATATVWLETLPEESTPRDRAALVIHEAFHVFQRETGRRWGADESRLFTYPIDHFALLTLRRLETEALRRALNAEDDETAAGWAGVALAERDTRFGRMDRAYVEYERGIELMEGTAAYLEHQAAGRGLPDIPADGFAADNVRGRAYVTGVSWALLLDRLAPGWQGGFAEDDGRLLDTDLAASLGDSGRSTACSFTDAELSEIGCRAQEDVLTLLKERVERREAFDSAPGWKLIVEAADGSPLWPQGFDPLNVTRVQGGVLHTRFLKLGNASGALEVMGGSALTEGVGPHPILNGVLRATVAGLDEEPAVEEAGGRVTVTTPTLTAEFEGAGVERSDEQIVIRLPAGEE